MKWVAGVVFSVQIRFIFYAVLGTYGPSHFKTEGCLDSIYFRCSAQDLLPLLSEIVACWGCLDYIYFISSARDLRPLAFSNIQTERCLDSIYLRCSVQHLLPSLSEIVACWGVQITFNIYVVLGTFTSCIEKLSHVSITKFYVCT